MKQARIEKAAVPTGEQLAAINRHSRRELGAQEVYVFSLILCDNEVDRDGERFTPGALGKLAKLFEGKTGVFDHKPSGQGQTARIFSAGVEEDSGRLTDQGEVYTCLRAWAYMARCPKNEDLILEIDAGIKKEVSVGCAVASRLCSVCGETAGSCDHQPGGQYDGKRCHVVLDNPVDAYEWSFVAVPAQPAAGVTKGYDQEREARELRAQVAELREKAVLGERYLGELRARTVRFGLLAQPGIAPGLLEKSLSALDAGELEELGDYYEAQASRRLPLVQLAGSSQPPERDGAFII